MVSSVKPIQEIQLMDSKEASGIQRVSERTLERMRAKRQIPFTRIGGKVFYEASNLCEFIRANTVEANQLNKTANGCELVGS